MSSSSSNDALQDRIYADDSNNISPIGAAIKEGFLSLAAEKERHSSSSTPIILPHTDPELCSVKIHFADPLGDRENHPSYFALIENILHRDHRDTLRNVPYQNLRNNTSTVIESIGIRCEKRGSSGSSISTKSTANLQLLANANPSSASNKNFSNQQPFAMNLLFGRRGMDASKPTEGMSSSSMSSLPHPKTGETMAAANNQDEPNKDPLSKLSNSSSSAVTTSAMDVTSSGATPKTTPINATDTKDTSDVDTNISPSKSMESSINNATSWHTGQSCHVYIAACENMEQYRNKVRPSLQAFVSQLDSNVKATTGGANSPFVIGTLPSSSSSNTNAPPAATSLTSNQYVIVYVPISGQSHGNIIANSASGIGGALRAMRGNHRNENDSNNVSAGILDLSMHSTHSSFPDSSGGNSSSNNSNNNNGNAADFNLSPREREVYRRLTHDFPHGRVCALSTLLLTDGAGGTGMSIMNPQQTAAHQQEWNVFLKNLASAITAGFLERVQRYDEELRRLTQRRTFTKNYNGLSSHYFLVKESLAFSYEQMQLLNDAQLQYEELVALLPSVSWNEGINTSGTTSPISELFDAAKGAPSSFRKLIRQNSVTDIELYHYICTRQVHLFFKMHRPVDAIARTHKHIEYVYRSHLKNPEFSRIHAEAISLSMCWEVKYACDLYFSFSTKKKDAKSTNMKASTSMDKLMATTGVASALMLEVARGTGAAEKEREASRQLSSTLEFARLRLLTLGDILLIKNPIRLATLDRPLDTLKEWPRWIPPTSSPSLQEESEMPPNDTSENGTYLGDMPAITRSKRLKGCFVSRSAYEREYLNLLGAIVSLHEHAGRYRFTARLLTERAEIHMMRKEYAKAGAILSKIIESTATRDQLWDQTYFWRLFRLACCQRMYTSPTTYLKTLVRCFTPRLAALTPPPTATLFQRDLEDLIEQESVKDFVLSIAPLFEIEIIVTSPNEGCVTYSQHPLGFLRKKLTQYTCLVGDTMALTVSISSSLPKAIMVDRLRIYLVTFNQYEKAYRRQGRNQGVYITENDCYRILNFSDDNDSNQIIIKPGKNEFQFQWLPMSTGQFALASMDMQWKHAAFFHDVSTFRRPIQGIEVRPSKATQKVELNPLFLIPGHEQEIRLVFNSGEDIVTEGSVFFACSDGLTILVPGENPSNENSWRKICTVKLHPCGPKTTRLIKTLVRSAVVSNISNAISHKSISTDGMSGVQTLYATVETSYHHNLYNKLTDGEGGEPKSNPMEKELKVLVTTLDRPALTVYKVEAVATSKEKVLVSVALHCNTPMPFFIKEWDMTLPPPLVVEEGGDLNEGLFEYPVSVGEELFFGFSCKRFRSGDTANISKPQYALSSSLLDESNMITTTTTPLPSNNRPMLHVVLQDEIGKTFHQVLPLDLDLFYEKMKKEDEYGGMNIVSAELTSAMKEGVVDSPVNFTFHVDISNLDILEQSMISAKQQANYVTNKLLFSITCDENDWILAGRVHGVIERLPNKNDMYSLNFLGIPTRSGVLTRFPEINIAYIALSTENSGLPSITVNCSYPDSFRSLSYTNHMALATPSILEVTSASA